MQNYSISGTKPYFGAAIMAAFAKKQYFCRSKTKQAHMNIESVAAQMAVLFILVIAGFVAHKCGIMGGDFDKRLSNLVIQLTCPCLIVSSTMGDTMPDRSLILPLLGVGTLTYVVLIALAYILPRFMPVRREDRGMYSFMLTFANVGFIGYPTVASIFGQSAVFYASILNAPNTFTVFIWGIMFVTGQKSGGFRWSLLYSPAMVATYLSIIIVAMGWRTPDIVARPLTLLGGITVPAALLVIGSSIAGMPARRMMGSKGTYVMCLFRLLLLPVGIYYLMAAIGAAHEVAAINAVLIGMPVASFGTMFCMKYGRDDTVMAQGTFISTLLSVASIPLLAMIIG